MGDGNERDEQADRAVADIRELAAQLSAQILDLRERFGTLAPKAMVDALSALQEQVEQLVSTGGALLDPAASDALRRIERVTERIDTARSRVLEALPLPLPEIAVRRWMGGQEDERAEPADGATSPDGQARARTGAVGPGDDAAS